MGRSPDKHLDNQELAALVPWTSDTGQDLPPISPEGLREVEGHAESCPDCSRKVSRYRQVASGLSNAVVSQAIPPDGHCPRDEDIEWAEVAAGQWPDLKSAQLLMHAALCDRCGPLLRAAISVDDDPTPQEERLLAELKAPSRPVTAANSQTPPNATPRSIWRPFLQWNVLVPSAALVLFVVLLSTLPWSSRNPLSGPEYARLAVATYKQHAQGSLALDFRSDSQQRLNQWLKTNSKFPLALPASPLGPGENRPFRLLGARLFPVGRKTAAYIAYQMQTGPAGLMVTPDSVAIASDGVEVSFKKVTFHYGVVEAYKVVTWSLHGLTYALVSQEGNSTQQSCMVCHSAMKDRDLSHTPTPLRDEISALESVWHSRR